MDSRRRRRGAWSRSTCFALMLMVLAGMVSCRAEEPSPPRGDSENKESDMPIYPKIYADYQQSSFQQQTTDASGDQVWFTPEPDPVYAQPPTLIVAIEDGLAVQSLDRFRYLTYDGKIVWEEPRDPGMDVFAYQNQFYFRTGDRRLNAVDLQRTRMLSGMHVATASSRGFFPLVVPRGQNHFLVQTFNRAEELMPDDPPKLDDYNLVLMGPDRWNDWDWLKEFEGSCLTALVTADTGRLVLLNSMGHVITMAIDSGDEVQRFELPGAEFLKASLDRDDNLVVVLVTPEGERKLCRYSLTGELSWEFMLPAKGGILGQPPAIDADNRVYYMENNILRVIDKGELQWEYRVPPARHFQFLTILGDNSVLVASANSLTHLDADGGALFVKLLEAGQQISTPPVVDNRGRIYVGTAAGIYCFD